MKSGTQSVEAIDANAVAVGRPADHQHEDQPDVFVFHTGPIALVPVLPDRAVALLAPAPELPETRTKSAPPSTT